MVNWYCPACEGGFARPARTEEGDACPWCGKRMEEQPMSPDAEGWPVITHKADDDDREPRRGPIGRMLFGEKE